MFNDPMKVLHLLISRHVSGSTILHLLLAIPLEQREVANFEQAYSVDLSRVRSLLFFFSSFFLISPRPDDTSP